MLSAESISPSLQVFCDVRASLIKTGAARIVGPKGFAAAFSRAAANP
jgi:hypothetical protein